MSREMYVGTTLLALPISGHVFRVERTRGPVWYAKYRLPDGRQVQKKIGPAWTGRGRPGAGSFTKRTAQAWLDDVLAQARRGELAGMGATGGTVADAAAEWLRWAEHDRACKPSTLTDYRHTANRIVRDLGELRLEDVTPELLERWKTTLDVSNRTIAKYLVIFHGIFKRAMKVWGLPRNPAADVERPRFRVSDDIQAFSPEEVHALVRAAAPDQDAALYLTAALRASDSASSSRCNGATSTSPARPSGCDGATTSTAGSEPRRAARSVRSRWS